jgi:2-aminoadipate transaminase
VVAEYMHSGDYARVVDLLRDAFRERRDQMLRALAAEMPPGTTWTEPAGGYFIWVELPPGLDGRALLPVAEAAGTSLLPGSAFFIDDGAGAGAARLAFSRYAPATLGEAVARLAASVRSIAGGPATLAISNTPNPTGGSS